MNFSKLSMTMDNVLFICYIDFHPTQMGVQTIYNQVTSSINTKKLFITKHKSWNGKYYHITDDNDKINEIMSHYKEIYILYPSQMSGKIFRNASNINHIIIIHDLFFIELSQIYSLRKTNTITSDFNIDIKSDLTRINSFDIQLLYFPIHRYIITGFKNPYYIQFPRIIKHVLHTNIDHTPNIIYPAQLQYRKNHNILNTVLHSYDIDCIITCCGNHNIPEYDKQQLKKLKENIHRNLRLVNYLDNKHYEELSSKCSGFIYPSIAEGGGFVIEEHITRMKPIAVNNYYSLSTVVFDLIPIDIPINIIRKIHFSNVYKTSSTCALTKDLQLPENKLISKIDMLNKICEKYLPNIYIFDACNLEETKKALDWICNFQYSTTISDCINNIKFKENSLFALESCYNINNDKNFQSLMNLNNSKLSNLQNLYSGKIIIVNEDYILTNDEIELYNNEHKFGFNNYKNDLPVSFMYLNKDIDTNCSISFFHKRMLNEKLYNNNMFLVDENELYNEDITKGLLITNSSLENMIQISSFIGFKQFIHLGF